MPSNALVDHIQLLPSDGLLPAQGRGDTGLVDQDSQGVHMKVNVEIDCTPLEARQFFGLPDVQPMQTAVMEKLQHQMMDNIQKVSPEALMQSWLSFDPKFAERFSDMFAAMTGLSTGLGGTRSPDKK
jgi:hypothetical protein